ncbi:MAG: DUF2169 domain-containing protein [Byssovorax sp.]
MEVVSLSALPVDSVAWQPSPGATTLTVICKATFTLDPGESPLAAEQQPITDEDRVASRPAAGIVLVGPGFPHGDHPGRAPVAHIVVGDVDSKLEIQAETHFDEELGPLSVIRADERLLLENLHAEHPRLLTRLPGVRPFAFLDRLGAPQRFGFEADTLWIDTARALCTLTFRVAIPLRSADEQGTVLVLLAQAGQEPTWADIPPRRLPMISIEDLARGDEIEGPIDDVEGPLDDPDPDRDDDAANDFEGEHQASLPTQRPPALTLPFDLSLVDLKQPELPFPARAEAPTPPPPPSETKVTASQTTALPFRASPTGIGIAIPSAPIAAPSTALPPPIPPPRHSEPVKFGAPPIAPPRAVEPHFAAQPITAPPPPMPAPPLQMPAPPPQMPAPPPPMAAPVSAASARASGGFFASAAAAAASEPRFARVPEPAPAPAKAGAPRPSSPKLEPEGAIQLVFYDPESMPRIRRTPRWRSILLDLEKRPPDPDLEDPAFAKDPSEVEDRREIFEVLARGAPCIAIEINEALVAAVRDDGKLVPPLLLASGELQLPFDEIETLRATVTTVTPLAGNDENLRASIDIARQFLAIPGLATAPAVAEGLTARIREAWNQGKRMVAPGYLDAQTERALTEQRHYQKRTVFGGTHLRALLHAGGSSPIPTYLRESVAKVLPLYARFKVRVVVEVHLQIDPYETHQAALRGLALARVSPLPKR